MDKVGGKRCEHCSKTKMGNGGKSQRKVKSFARLLMNIMKKLKRFPR